jgi:excisionase family DNA binding protein
MKQEFKTSEVAKIFNLTNTAIINWIKSGKLPAYETGGGHYRVMRDDLIEFVKSTGRPLSKELLSDKYRILIVDDEKTIIDAVKLMLEDIGVELEIETALDGLQAGYKICSFLPHLIILDAIMPGADGDSVVKLVKKNEELKKTKILAFTGYPSEGKKLVKLGANKYIVKASQESAPDPFRKEVSRLLGVKYTKVIIKETKKTRG